MERLKHRKLKKLSKRERKEEGINKKNSATLRNIRLSPIKTRLITREVQGMNGELALASLEFMPNKAAKILSKVISSAIANIELEPEEVIISSCRVDKASVLKRFRARARGTASRILKPTSHISVEVTEINSYEKEGDV